MDNGLTEVTLPPALQRIDSCAFTLSQLTRVEIPSACTFIGYGAFDEDVELVFLGSGTHVETRSEYIARTGDDGLPVWLD